MIKSVVKFFGDSTDPHGMPVPYYSYLVVSSPWQTQGSGVASIVPLADGNVVSNSGAAAVNQHQIAMSGGEKAAYEKAVNALKSAATHANLHFHEHVA